MFLLGIGEVLEEWTHKKSVNDLARSMSLNIGRVWVLTDGKEILADADEIRKGTLSWFVWEASFLLTAW